MADILNDGNIRVYWVTTISNTSAPTTTELNAGVALESYITPDGYSITTSDDSVDTSALNSADNTAVPGRRNDEISITFKHQGDSAAPWTTFASRPDGYLVERTSIAGSTAWAASQKVRVFTVKAGSRQKAPRAANEVEKFTVEFSKTGATQDSATVGA